MTTRFLSDEILPNKLQREFSIISNNTFDLFVAENISHLRLRPSDENDSRVVINTPGFERLVRWVTEMNERVYATLNKYGKGSDNNYHWPTLEQLFWCVKQSFQYITFNQLVQTLLTLADHAVSLHTPKQKNVLYFLAIPDFAATKSTLWFSARVWSILRQVVDYIVPNTNTVQDILRRMEGYKAIIFYVDDMNYSGQQMGTFGQTSTPMSDFGANRIEIYPITAYQADGVPAAIRHFSEGMTYQNTLTHRVLTPQYWLNNIAKFTQSFDRDEISTPEILEVRDVLMQLTDPVDRFGIQLYQSLVDALDKPVVIFEHKLADSVSVPISFFDQLPYHPFEENEKNVSQRQLLFIDRARSPLHRMGTSAFYKYLKWYFQGKVLDENRLTPLTFP